MNERDAVEQFLELGMSGLAPSVHDKDRHRAALERRLALDGTGNRVRQAAPGPVRGWSALRASGAAGWATGALLLCAGVGLGFWLGATFDELSSLQQQPAAPSAAVIDAAPDRVALLSTKPVSSAERSEARSGVSERAPHDAGVTSFTTIVEPPHASVAMKPARRATSHRHPSDREPSVVEPVVAEPFDEELALLQRVERALRAQHSGVAVALLAELDDRFPRTHLGEERQAARLIAECQLQLPEALHRAERFLAERGGSVYAQRVHAACAPEGNDDFSAPEKARQPADTLRR